MKVLMLNASPHENGCIRVALDEIAETLKTEGIESEILWLGNGALFPCSACGYCHKNGRCVHEDVVNRINDRADEFDALILSSPVHYSQASAQAATVYTRLFYSGAQKWAYKAAAAVVSARRGGTTATFEQLNQYFLISNMYVIGSCYWNNIHGNKPEEAGKDAEGLHIMRQLAHNMAFFLKCRKEGEKAGIVPLIDEGRFRTNFMDGK